jgi:putative FmdB family regulatory protein
MPLYEYECAVCAHAFERMVAVNRRDAKQACPECGAGKVARKVSTFAAQSGGNSADADWCAPCNRPRQCGIGNGGCGAGLCGF